MSAHVLLNLLNDLRKKRLKARSWNVKFYVSYGIKNTLKSHF